MLDTACALLNHPSPGVKLVLEGDGTIIDEDEVLFKMAPESLMLLHTYEQWRPSEEVGLFRSSAQFPYMQGFNKEPGK